MIGKRTDKSGASVVIRRNSLTTLSAEWYQVHWQRPIALGRKTLTSTYGALLGESKVLGVQAWGCDARLRHRMIPIKMVRLADAKQCRSDGGITDEGSSPVRGTGRELWFTALRQRSLFRAPQRLARVPSKAKGKECICGIHLNNPDGPGSLTRCVVRKGAYLVGGSDSSDNLASRLPSMERGRSTFSGLWTRRVD